MFKVHKVILASRSYFFATACWGFSKVDRGMDFTHNMLNLSMQEAKPNIIDLPNDEPELVKKMVEYLYALDYEVGKDTTMYVDSIDFQGGTSPATVLDEEEVGDFPSQSRTQHTLSRGVKTCWEALHEALQQQQTHDFDDTMDLLVKQKTPPSIESIQHGKARLIPAGELAIHASMYSLADKYGIEGLKSTCVRKMTAALQGIGWDQVWTFHSPQARMEEFAAAVAIAWSTTPASDRDLRTVLLDYSVRHVKRLVKLKEFEEAFRRLPQFAFELMARVTAGADEELIAPALPLSPPSAMSAMSSSARRLELPAFLFRAGSSSNA